MALDRQAEARHAREHARMPGDDDADLLGPDAALGRLHAFDHAVDDVEAGHFAVLDDIDAALVRLAGEAPGDRVMARDTAAALEAGTQDRIPRGRRDIDHRHDLL